MTGRFNQYQLEDDCFIEDHCKHLVFSIWVEDDVLEFFFLNHIMATGCMQRTVDLSVFQVSTGVVGGSFMQLYKTQ